MSSLLAWDNISRTTISRWNWTSWKISPPTPWERQKLLFLWLSMHKREAAFSGSREDCTALSLQQAACSYACARLETLLICPLKQGSQVTAFSPWIVPVRDWVGLGSQEDVFKAFSSQKCSWELKETFKSTVPGISRAFSTHLAVFVMT